MQSQITEITPVLIEVKVQIPWDHVSTHLEAELKKVTRNAKIRGFRPGKAPVGVVRKVYGPQIEAEVSSQLVQEGINRAVEEHEIQLVARPELGDFSKIAQGEPFVYTAKMEVRPKIESIDLDGLEIYRDLDEVTPAQIDEEIARLRKQNADLQEPEPMRPAKEGDKLIVDYKISIEGEPADDLAAEDSELELGQSAILPELEAGLLGLQPGESKDIVVAFPEDHQSPRFKGKSITFHTTVKTLRERVLPELDDDFAKDCGDFETLAALRADIEKRFTEAAQKRSETSIRDQLIQTLVDKNEVPVPKAMVEEQKRAMLYEVFQIAQMMGQPPNFEQLMGQAEERAPRRVRAGLLLSTLAMREKIEVTPSELDAKLAEIAEKTGKHIAKVKAEYREDRLAQLENELLESRLLEYLKGKAKIIEGKRPAPPSEEKSGE